MNNYQFDIALSFATENQDLVDRVYHYLKARGIHVFFAPSQEGQVFLAGENQREIFYKIYGMSAKYVALFVSKYYITRSVPMEEASIAFAEHSENSTVIPIYLDEAELPNNMLDPRNMNYFRSNDPAKIASHLAAKINGYNDTSSKSRRNTITNIMDIEGNKAIKQVYIQNN